MNESAGSAEDHDRAEKGQMSSATAAALPRKGKPTAAAESGTSRQLQATPPDSDCSSDRGRKKGFLRLDSKGEKMSLSVGGYGGDGHASPGPANLSEQSGAASTPTLESVSDAETMLPYQLLDGIGEPGFFCTLSSDQTEALFFGSIFV